MCLLGAKAGSKPTTVTQTIAHNAFTGIGDCDFGRWYFKAHAKAHTPAELEAYVEGINYIQMHMEAAYKRAQELWHLAMCTDCTADPLPATVHEHTAPPPNWTPLQQEPRWSLMEGE